MPKPEYQHIVDDITARIRAGQLAPGEKLPPYRQLAADYDVSRSTVRTALMILAERGWTVGRPGKGTFVADRPPSV